MPKANKEIKAQTVRLIDENGIALGIFELKEALRIAETKSMDLLEISPTADPPVCKISDLGKYKYDAKKKANESKKKQKIVKIKEIKFGLNIAENDYRTKCDIIKRSIGEGNKAKITLRFKGREIAYKDKGLEFFERIKVDMTEFAKVESEAKFEGKQISMVLISK